MTIKYASDYGEMSDLASSSLIATLKEQPEQLLCVATGYSPLGMYKNLAKANKSETKGFENLSILKLDEWGGIPASDPNSCESYIKQHILRALGIPLERYIAFECNPASPEQECERIQGEIEKNGPIDVCILGLGKNGHIGFNEPCDVLTPFCHVAELSEESLGHQMANDFKNKPTYGLTLGMADILQSKKIILLLTGSNKKDSIDRLLSKQITTRLPASFLWLHPNVECYVDLSSKK